MSTQPEEVKTEEAKAKLAKAREIKQRTVTQKEMIAENHVMSLMKAASAIEFEKAWVLHRALVEGGAKPEEADTLRNLGQAPSEDMWNEEQRQALSTKYFNLLMSL